MPPRCLSSTATRELQKLLLGYRAGVTPQIHHANVQGRRSWQHCFSSTAHNEQKRVAIIGAGIAGLSTAYHLAKDPRVKVTIYEKNDKIGGWLQSETLDINGGKVLFEYGARTFRGGLKSGLAPLELVYQLDLLDDVITIDMKAPASRNRYIYYPNRLVALANPQVGGGGVSNIITTITEPIMASMMWGIISEMFRRKRDPKLGDESIGDFVSRRFGKGVADNLVSAVYHGIFAGDIYKLSKEALLPRVWKLESSKFGLLGEMARNIAEKKSFNPSWGWLKYLQILRNEEAKEYTNYATRILATISAWTLKGGVSQLATALHSSLSRNPRVAIKTGAQISRISKPNNGGLAIEHANGRRARFDYVVSTTSSSVLAEQLHGPANGTRSLSLATPKALLKNNYAVNVMVVNLFYKTPNLIPQRGFGYLIPQSVQFERNPERALGAMFLSDMLPSVDTAEGTKLAVMLGGHWWDGWADEDFPSEELGIEQAKSVLQRHLGITEEPIVARARLLKNAIPQYTVGHVSRMQDVHDSLKQEFDSRLKVTGAWYNGVGVGDCTLNAKLVANSILWDDQGTTGLEPVLNDAKCDVFKAYT